MTQYVFKLPDIGEGTAEAELVGWHVSIGDVVEEDQPLADVMTDKATVELTSPVAGKIRSLHGEVGQLSSVGSPLIVFDVAAGEPFSDSSASGDTTKGIETVAAISLPAASARENETLLPDRPNKDLEHEGTVSEKPVLALPSVRHRARELGIPLAEVHGSGSRGVIRQSDLDAWLAYRGETETGTPIRDKPKVPKIPNPPQAQSDDWHEVKLAGLRRKIAQKMELSTRSIPHFSYIEEADVTELEQVRTRLNSRYRDTRAKLSFLPFFIRALCRILPDYPQINALFDEEKGIARYYRSIHVGIATQTPQGLIVPVLVDAQRCGLWELADRIAHLADATRKGTATRAELSGSTITITSLGTLGGVATTPVINHPEVAIVGPNRIIERPVVRDGQIAVRKVMNISSSFDHRIVDGYDAARFVQDLRQLLEDPTVLLAH